MFSFTEASRLREFLYRDPQEIEKDIKVVQRFKNTQAVEEVLLNRKPSLLLEEAVIIIVGQLPAIITRMHVSPDLCDGHYPACPFLSLSHQLELVGQTGALLLNTQCAKHFTGTVPLVYGSQEMRWGNSGLILPGTDLFAVAKINNCRFGFAKANVMIVSKDEIVLTVEDVKYIAFKISELERIGETNNHHER